jgi:hypothetical protein
MRSRLRRQMLLRFVDPEGTRQGVRKTTRPVSEGFGFGNLSKAALQRGEIVRVLP